MVLREKFKERTYKNESTNTKYRGGLLHRSDETFVMKVEQRE